MKQIVKQLIIVGLVTILSVGTVIFSTILINERGINDGQVINIAGRERMLSQKIAKEIFIINSQDKFDFAELDQAVFEFEEALLALRFGNKQMGINPPIYREFISQLEHVGQRWRDFKYYVDIFKSASKALDEGKRFLDENNDKLLEHTDKVVQAMVNSRFASKEVDPIALQRMLTQRMAYHLMRYTNKWDAHSYDELLAAFKLYEKTILGLFMEQKYKKHPALRKEIEETYAFWKLYSEHINNVLVNQKRVVEALDVIALENPKLLAEIHKSVEFYTIRSTSRRNYLEHFQYGSAAILLLVALYSLLVLRGIKNQFDEFINRSKKLAQMEFSSKDEARELLDFEGDGELSEVSRNLSKFFERIEGARQSSNRAKELSERITEEIALITDEVFSNIDKLNLSEEEKRKISSEIDRSEDIAIQSSERLIATAKLLERLRESLDNIAKHYPKPTHNGRDSQK